jgi:formylglycine-generating enzyme required for sulfatase activity
MALIWNDKSTIDDRLGFEDYRRTLERIVRGADTPITVGVFGRWGSGKTSLMRMVQHDLEQPTPATKLAPAQTIWFDAWKYDKQDVLWRALLLQVLRTLREALPEAEQETRQKFFDLQASLYREVDRTQLGGIEVDWDKLFPELAQSAVKLSLSFIPGWDALNSLLDTLKAQPEAQAKAVFDAIHRERVRIHEDQAKSLEQFQDRFEQAVTAFLQITQRPFIAVFVDDLDRCLPEKAIEVLEAIKLFLDVRGCAFVLGIDHKVIEDGIKLRYQGRMNDLDLSKVGEEYIEKIVQVPFNLPPLEADNIEQFIAEEIKLTFPPPLAKIFALGLTANPRKIKRTLNIFRLLVTLAQQRKDANGRALLDSLSFELLAKIVIIQTSFRKLYEAVVEYPNLLGDLERHFETPPVVGADRRVSPETPSVGADRRVSPEAGEHIAGEHIAGERIAGERIAGEHTGSPLPTNREGEHTGSPLPIDAESTTLVGQYAKEKTLKVLLLAGKERFRDSVNTRPYIYLTRTAAPQAEVPAAEMDKQLWDDLLSNDATRVRAATEKIEQAETQEKGTKDGYIKRLLYVIANYQQHPAKERVSAGNALAYLGDPRDFDELVEIPAGEFLYGENKETRKIEKPFRIGKYPVTNAQYKKFAHATKREVPEHWDKKTRMYSARKANHPVVNVSWDDAQAYCEWLSKTTGKQFRLPLEEEWERAARYTDGREYPWGDEFDTEKANTSESGLGDTSPVGVYPNGASQDGALDMVGNVWEWTASEWENESARVLRGGSWFNPLNDARCTVRFDSFEVIFYGLISLRVVREPVSF